MIWHDGGFKRQPKHVAILYNKKRCAVTELLLICDCLYFEHTGMSQLEVIIFVYEYVRTAFYTFGFPTEAVFALSTAPIYMAFQFI